jgi:hypothetical protein
MVMLQHLHAQIHLQMNCGNFLYGSTVKLILSILDPADSTKNFLTSGAFEASNPESLYAKS